MKLYLAGPMSGLPEHNFPAFFSGAAKLRTAGYNVVNPAERETRAEMLAMGYTLNLKADIKLVVDCDGVALLPGWENSKGAKLEISVARALNIPVMTMDWWLSREPSSTVTWVDAGSSPLEVGELE
jgi:nucleoside 2-deoxyribosyltransferase